MSKKYRIDFRDTATYCDVQPSVNLNDFLLLVGLASDYRVTMLDATLVSLSVCADDEWRVMRFLGLIDATFGKDLVQAVYELDSKEYHDGLCFKSWKLVQEY